MNYNCVFPVSICKFGELRGPWSCFQVDIRKKESKRENEKNLVSSSSPVKQARRGEGAAD